MKRADHICGLLRSSRRERTRSITIPFDNTANQSESKLVYTSTSLLLSLSRMAGEWETNSPSESALVLPSEIWDLRTKRDLGITCFSLLHETLGYQPPDRASSAINMYILSNILSCCVTSSHNHGLLDSLPISKRNNGIQQ